MEEWQMTRKGRPKTSIGMILTRSKLTLPSETREAQELEVGSKPEGRGLKMGIVQRST